ncbi:hypothetical protein Tsubulata_004411 [Turnera subulata]|uniref:Cyclin C-terminal domain-containing protein n=1 Tax=Turnera subulata TaxID=218843 RepID=A0A9Q0FE77_9ROSI|nr:hypothetical protein Tsubulata_004411 [Turnera subulata]
MHDIGFTQFKPSVIAASATRAAADHFYLDTKDYKEFNEKLFTGENVYEKEVNDCAKEMMKKCREKNHIEEHCERKKKESVLQVVNPTMLPLMPFELKWLNDTNEGNEKITEDDILEISQKGNLLDVN